jgi:oligopeptide transport system permease protein
LGWTSRSFINTESGNPLDSQFLNYIFGAVRGDLGPSYRQRGLDVQDILFRAPEGKPFWHSRFGYSLRLGLLAVTMATFLGIPLGIVGALKRNSPLDYISIFISTVGISVPSFVLAIFFIIIFASRLKLVKIVQQDWGSPGAWLVPAAILGFGTFAYITRLTRSTMLEVMQQDYVRTARAKGLQSVSSSAAHAAQFAHPGHHDPGACGGGPGDRFLHHRADVFLPW